MSTKRGKGTVTAGTPMESLKDGKCVVKVLSLMGENDGLFQYDDNGEVRTDKQGKPVPAVSEHQLAEVVYPSGYSRTHQVKTADDLLDRMMSQIRNYYGVGGNIEIVTKPKLEAGAQAEFHIG